MVPADSPMPPWLADALAREPRSVTATLDGVDLHRLEWGRAGRPAVVLLHGGGAHAGWWRAVGGVLAAAGWHVIAPDVTGHGRSSHRPGYTFGSWGAEVMAVIGDAGVVRPTIVGHSMCGVVAAVVGARWGDRLAGVVVVDTPLGIPSADAIGHAEQRMAAPRLARTAEELHDRFRLLPDQPVVHAALLRLVAQHSVAERGAGWTWAFDPAMFLAQPGDRPTDLIPVIESAACPVAVVIAARSPVVPARDRDRLAELAARHPALQVIDLDAHHHPMLDRPAELAALLGDLASG